MAQTLEFQQAHLDRVSRSFAFCIRRLPEPLGRWVGLTYLICRILDTIEDAEWTSDLHRRSAFEKFEAAVSAQSECERLAGWATDFPDVVDGERRLLQDAVLVLTDLHELPPTVRESVQGLVLSMSSGMRHFLEGSKQSGGALHLKTLAEVNQYCFFVAGLVGEALLQLIAAVEPRFPVNAVNLLRAHHFGLFLQKVNILKDQNKDEEQGRHLVPSREAVEASAGLDAREALAFLCSLPDEQVEFRQFCGWSLFLGLETLVVSRASRGLTAVKLLREQTVELLAKIDSIVSDNELLQEHFLKQTERLNWTVRETAKPLASSPEWLLHLYRGRLDSRSLGELGI